MLDITVKNCDDVQVNYAWDSIDDFLNDMASDKEEIPMLDDLVINMEVWDKPYNREDLENKGIYTVENLVEWCIQHLNQF